jgi:hypothetical protein
MHGVIQHHLPGSLNVEQFIAHPAIEGFDIAVLHRLARRDVVPFDLVTPRPSQDRIRRELGAVVGDDHARLAASFDECRQFASHTTAGERGVRDRCQALTRDIIDDVEDAETSATGKLIMDEI